MSDPMAWTYPFVFATWASCVAGLASAGLWLTRRWGWAALVLAAALVLLPSQALFIAAFVALPLALGVLLAKAVSPRRA